ncbi:MAG TPA: Pr6Pr family membrane protein [Acidocella sp.]|nr:Pr6Pr family membrane protein [Acidocella sp.]
MKPQHCKNSGPTAQPGFSTGLWRGFYRATGASLGWFAVLAQYYLSIGESGLAAGTGFFFGYFTILGNMLVASAFLAPFAAGRGRFFERPGVRTAIAVYILVIAIVFHVLLRQLYHPVGLGWYVNLLLHYIMPPLYILDWVLFVPKQNLRFSQIPYWLIFPLAYATATLAHGALSGYYPYPFLDAGKYGYGRVLPNIAGLTGFFLLLSAGFVGVAKLPKRALAPGRGLG